MQKIKDELVFRLIIAVAIGSKSLCSRVIVPLLCLNPRGNTVGTSSIVEMLFFSYEHSFSTMF